MTAESLKPVVVFLNHLHQVSELQPHTFRHVLVWISQGLNASAQQLYRHRCNTNHCYHHQAGLFQQ